MDTPKFTPGRWRFGVRPDGSMWLSLGDPVKGPHYQGDLVATVADANVIVAARELYAALEVVSSDGWVDLSINDQDMWLKRSTAALALARGEA